MSKLSFRKLQKKNWKSTRNDSELETNLLQQKCKKIKCDPDDAIGSWISIQDESSPSSDIPEADELTIIDSDRESHKDADELSVSNSDWEPHKDDVKPAIIDFYRKTHKKADILYIPCTVNEQPSDPLISAPDFDIEDTDDAELSNQFEKTDDVFLKKKMQEKNHVKKTLISQTSNGSHGVWSGQLIKPVSVISSKQDLSSENIIESEESFAVELHLPGKGELHKDNLNQDAEVEVSNTSYGESSDFLDDNSCSSVDDNNKEILIKNEGESEEVSSFTSPLKLKKKVTTTDLLKDINWQMDTPKKITYQRTAQQDSAKKKFLKGGNAERLKKLISRENSSVSVWKYEMLSANWASGLRKMLTVKIMKIWREYAQYVTECEIISFEGGINTLESDLLPSSAALAVQNDRILTYENYKRIVALFSERIAKDMCLRSGSIVKIHSPWKLMILSYDKLVILCTNYTEFVSLDDSSLSSTEEQNAVHGSIICLDTDISKNPEQDQRHHSFVKNFMSSQFTMQLPVSSKNLKLNDVSNRNSGTKYMKSLLEIIEQQGFDFLTKFTFAATVQRVIKQASRCNTEKKWTLLLMDKDGMVSELELLTVDDSMKKPFWIDVVADGEGNFFCFENLRILQKNQRRRSPDVFTVIDNIREMYFKIKNKVCLSPQAVCYTLGITEDSNAICQKPEIECIYLPSKLLTLVEVLQDVDKFQRCSIFVKVLHRNSEELWVWDESFCRRGCKSRKSLLSSYQRFVCIYYTSAVLPCFAFGSGCILLMKDLLLSERRILADRFTSIQCFECSVSKTLPLQIDNNLVHCLKKSLLITNDDLSSSSNIKDLVKVEGTIIEPDETSSYAWPICATCKNPDLIASDSNENRGDETLFCKLCNQYVSKPVMKIRLEIYLFCQAIGSDSVKIKLKQESIEKLLPLTSFKTEGFEANCVMNRPFGPSICCVVEKTFIKDRQHFLLQEI